MPVLTFEQSPPNAEVFIDISSPPKLAPKTTQLHDVKSANAQIQDVEPTLPNNAYPVVRLDVDVISEATASRLAASLLGHVLFLKNQIPFPVIQLGRIPGGKTNSRAAKSRTELMASYDTISSHLDTTFSALATALARCSGPKAHSQPGITQAHVAILVGPSLGSAKAKVIMGIDGLEKKIWGMRSAATVSENNYENSKEEDEEEGDGEDQEDVESSEEEEDCPEDSEDEEDHDNEESEDENIGEDEDEESVVDGEEADEEEAEDDDEQVSAPPPPYISYAEEQKFLQSADRLLSRVLAAADAEGNGIASEMSPTQTHILIRAPRIFKHPAWVPRQNVTTSLDATLGDFLAASSVHPTDLPVPPSKQSSAKKSKVEGVWVTARGGIRASPESESQSNSNSKAEDENENDRKQQPGKPKEAKLHLPNVTDEDAEMIWWSWDGKFVGFSDW